MRDLDTTGGVQPQSYLRAGLVVLVLFLNLLPVPPQSPILVAITVIAVIWVGVDFLRQGAHIQKKHLVFLLLFFLLVVGVTLNPPVNEYGQFKASQILTAGMASAASVFLLRTEKDIEVFAGGIVLVAVIVGLGALTGQEFAQDRSSSFGSNPIWSARGLVAGIVCAIWLLIWRNRNRLSLVLGATICLFGLLRLDSRFAILAVFVGVVLMVIASRASGNMPTGAIGRRAPVAVGAIALLVGALFLLWFSGPRTAELLGSALVVGDEEIRLELWGSARDLWLTSPSGLGVGGFQTFSYLGTGYNYPHNFFLEALMEMGTFVGLSLVVLVLWTLFRATSNPSGSGPSALAAGLLGFSVVAVSFSGDMNSRVFFAVIVFAWVAMSMPKASISSPLVGKQRRVHS